MCLEPSLTDANRYGDIYPVNICPDDICPYKEYLSCYQLNCDQTSKVDSKKKIWRLIFRTRSFYPKLLCPKFVGLKKFWTLMFWTKTFQDLSFFYLNLFLDPMLLGLKFFGHGLFLDQKIADPIFFLTKTTIISTTKTKTLLGFDTIEINLVNYYYHHLI